MGGKDAGEAWSCSQTPLSCLKPSNVPCGFVPQSVLNLISSHLIELLLLKYILSLILYPINFYSAFKGPSPEPLPL